MKKNMLYLLFALLFISLASCDTSKKRLCNEWIIERIEIDGDTIAYANILQRILWLKSDGSCFLPPNFNYPTPPDVRGSWKIENRSPSLVVTIDSPESLLDGTYEVIFGYPPNKPEEAHFKSDKIQFTCWNFSAFKNAIVP